MPIEVKPSWKWSPDWWNIDLDEQTALGVRRNITDLVFYTPLSQLHYYMLHSGADYAGPTYGVLLTDEYMVPVKREGFIFGELQLAKPIRWDKYFAKDEEVTGFTDQSALWYLCMLASKTDWHYNGKEVHQQAKEHVTDYHILHRTEHRKQEK